MSENTENPVSLRDFRAGFVSIIGKPNVGKSTLMNVLVGEKMSIITSKAQTTRHRIMGILNGKHEDIPFQLVYSDTPGVVKPAYKLHDSMMTFVKGSLEDADVVLFVTEVGEKAAEHEVIPLLQRTNAPIILVLNKIDLSNEEELKRKTEEWEKEIQPAAIIPISALSWPARWARKAARFPITSRSTRLPKAATCPPAARGSSVLVSARWT